VKDNYFDRGDSMTVWAIEIRYGYGGEGDERPTRDEAKAQIEEAKRRLDTGERFEDLASEYNEDGSLSEYRFGHETRSMDKSFRASKREEAMRLSQGEISEIHENMNTFFILMCVEKEAEGYDPFEDAKGHVKIVYLNEKYEELVDDLVEAADVEINQPELDRVEIR
jgi:foldase protein PrsA